MTRTRHKSREPQRFDPELDGQGRVLSPVKKKHMAKASVGESPLAAALRQAITNGSLKRQKVAS